MMYEPKIKQVKKFKWSDLHKKTGTFIHMKPTDSCINEGGFMESVQFVTLDNGPKAYVIYERDIRDED